MKKLLLIAVVIWSALGFSGCSKSGNGELVGVQNRPKWRETQPYGMVFIRRGSFNIGPSDQDASMSGVPTKTVSQEAFWMDDTEITNNEYRQFVSWVRDSMARKMLGDQYPEFLNTEDRDGNPIDPPTLNWKEKIDWKDQDYQMAMQDMYMPEAERFFGKKEIDTRKLVYEFWWIDLNQAAKRSNSYNYDDQRYEGNVYDTDGQLVPITNRASFIMQDQVPVYPDTLTWIRDFTYSYNEPLATRYFWHPGFDDYPVVGVTWKQAEAFCNWRTKIQSDFLSMKGEPELQAYRLPTEVEWEYAARGGKNFSMFPWGGYYTRDDDGVFLANFKPLRGNYVEDGGIASMKVGSYDPNEYGLYDMAGNIAEWTSTAYDEAGYNYFGDLNATFTYNARPDDPPVMKRKVIRGGSWKDISSYIQVSTRSYEYQDTTKSYVGFRCVRSTFGEEF
jgi:formylglycine-generating enzyme required for sulfatase activity